MLKSWIRNNNFVISCIPNSVSKELLVSIICDDSAYEIWMDLKERYQERYGPRIFQLRRELMNLTQGQSFVGLYLPNLKTIWDELNNYKPTCTYGRCECGSAKKLVDHYPMKYDMSFFMGLNDSFA